MAQGTQAKTRGLLDLPDEIWSKSGKLVVDKEPVVRIQRNFQGRSKRLPPQPAITRTCTALRQELLPYYYKHKIDVYLQTWGLLDVLADWLAAIGPYNRAQVRGLYLMTSASTIEWWHEKLEREWSLSVEVQVVRGTEERSHWGQGVLKYMVTLHS